MEQPSLGSPSPQLAEVEELLQPSLHKSWADSLEEEEEMDFLEHSLEVQSGQGSQSLLHSNVEVSQVDTSMDGVEPVPPPARAQCSGPGPGSSSQGELPGHPELLLKARLQAPAARQHLGAGVGHNLVWLVSS